MATSENEDLVASVYAQALQDRHDKRGLTAADLMVYHIEMLSQEVNSSASFEQYFRWASVEEKSDLIEWTEEQEEQLGTAASEFEEFNGRVISFLAAFYRKSQSGA